MVYCPVTILDPSKTASTSETLIKPFNIPSLHDYQEKAGQNVLLGKNTFLDIPTGGDKTLSFYYPLFYHWQPGVTAKKAEDHLGYWTAERVDEIASSELG